MNTCKKCGESKPLESFPFRKDETRHVAHAPQARQGGCMNLKVIIPSRNISNLRPCLEAIWKHESGIDVIVIDDGLLERPEGPTYIDGIRPFVFARAVNQGIRAAGDADCVITNDDALLESPRGFQLMQYAALNHPEVGIIGATTNLTGQPLQRRQSDWNSYDWNDPMLVGMGPRIVPHIAFVCVLIPRRTRLAIPRMRLFFQDQWPPDDRFDEDGLLDERYCLDYGCEDADYCEQVTRAGLKVAVHDGCYVDHGRLTSTFRGDPRAAKSFAQNYKLLMEKWGKLESQPK